jgi:DNA-binding SARP family transcriptional activator
LRRVDPRAEEERGRTEFGVLGPLTIVRDGVPVSPGPGQRRAVLAALLCHVNQSVRTERLVDAVWGDDPPRTAAKNLQVHVYHLRRLFADPERIAYNFTGYTLRAAADEIDGARFERYLAVAEEALAGGDLGRAEERANAALALWRGPAFADLADARIVAREALRLNELRIVGHEVRNEIQLRAGRYRALVPELFRMLSEHPYRERVAGQLMTALDRDGRRADALGVYHRVRRALAEELAVDPSDRLTTLYTSILRGSDPDPAVEAHAMAPPGWASPAGRPVGRPDPRPVGRPDPRPVGRPDRRTGGRVPDSAPDFDRDTLEFLVAAVNSADCALSVGRLERLDVADPRAVPPAELHRPAGARRWLDRQHGTLQAALSAALERGWDSQAWRLAHGMYSLFRLRGDWAAWRATYDAAIAAATGGGADDAVAPLRVGLGAAFSFGGAPEEAARQLSLALPASRLHGNGRCQVAALIGLAGLALDAGRLDEAEGLLDQAEGLADEDLGLAVVASVWVLRLSGELHLERGDHDRAVGELEQALARAVALGDGNGIALAQCGLSRARLSRGDGAGGAAFARQAVAVASACRDLPAEQAARHQLQLCHDPRRRSGVVTG